MTPRVAARRRRLSKVSTCPNWVNIDGEPMFVVDFTPAGFPIGMRQENEPHWLDEE